jgi:multiple sugar transport system substrate-binding protein
LIRDNTIVVCRLPFALAVLTSLLLVGCGSPVSETTPRPTGPAPSVTVPFEMPVTIAITGRFGQGELAVLEEQIAAFEAANPDVYVEIVRAPTAPARRRREFLAQVQAGDPTLDILLLPDSWIAEFASGSWLRPLEDLVSDAGVELQGFFPAAVEASTIDGRLVALPWVTDGGALYYRSDVLDDLGLDPPGSWDELQALTMDALDESGLPFGFVWQGAAYDGLTCNTLEHIWTQGGLVVDGEGRVTFDTLETRRALEQMSQLIASGTSPSEVVTFREGETEEVFLAGDALLMRYWASAWDSVGKPGSPLAGKVGIAPLPASCLLGQHLALSASSQHPEAAFRFMAFLVDYEQQRQLAMDAGQMPALKAVYEDRGLLTSNPVYEIIHRSLSATRPRPAIAWYSEFSEVIHTEVNSLLQGGQSVEDTVSGVQDRLELIQRR